MSHSIFEARPFALRCRRWIGGAFAIAACVAAFGAASVASAQPAENPNKTTTGDPTDADTKIKATADATEVAEKQLKTLREQMIGHAVSDTDIDEINDAIKAFRERDFDQTRVKLGRAREKKPELPPEEVMFASLCFSFNLPQPARAELEKGVLKNPEDPEPYLIFADLAFQQQQVTVADVLFLKAKEKADAYKEANKRKRNFDIRVNAGLAAVCEAREQWKEAISYLDKWIAIDNKSAPAYQRLARAKFKEKPIAKAEESEKTRMAPVSAAMLQAARLIADLKKDNPDQKTFDPYVAMARLYEEAAGNAATPTERTEYRARAKAMFEFALNRAATSVDVNLAYANWLMSTGDTVGAQARVATALKTEPNNLDAQFLKGVIARFTKDWTTAETTFESLHARQPSNFLVSNQLALVLAESGAQAKSKAKLERALDYAKLNFDRFQQTRDAGPTAATTLGWVLYRLDRKQEAAQYIGAGARAGGLTPDALYYVAKVLSENEKTKPEAYQVIGEAVKAKIPFAHKKDAQDLHEQLKPPKSDEKKRD